MDGGKVGTRSSARQRAVAGDSQSSSSHISGLMTVTGPMTTITATTTATATDATIRATATIPSSVDGDMQILASHNYGDILNRDDEEEDDDGEDEEEENDVEEDDLEEDEENDIPTIRIGRANNGLGKYQMAFEHDHHSHSQGYRHGQSRAHHQHQHQQHHVNNTGASSSFRYRNPQSSQGNDGSMQGVALGFEGLNLMVGPSNGSVGTTSNNDLAGIMYHDSGDGMSALNSASAGGHTVSGLLGCGNTSADLRAAIVSNWLTEHYEPHDNISLPRSVLYDHYLDFCQQQSTEPVNSATFGKIIRSVFPMLRTRRLGTRGNSKYHYFGIGLKTSLEECDRFSSIYAQYSRPPPARPRVSRKGSLIGGSGHQTDYLADASSASGTMMLMASSSAAAASTVYSACALGGSGKGLDSRGAAGRRKRSHKGMSNGAAPDAFADTFGLDQAPTNNDGDFGKLGNGAFRSLASPNYEDFAHFLEQICLPVYSNVPSHVAFESVQAFSCVYQQHVIDLLRAVSSHEFSLVEGLSEMFWLNFPGEMVSCLHCEESLRIVAIADDYLYQVLIHTLIPDVLEPVPMGVTQSIRQFAKALEGVLLRTLQTPIPQGIVDVKLDAARRFCQVLRRRTSLSHLTQAVRSILGNTEHTTQMLHDWGHVDFAGIREQADWVLRAKEGILPWIESSFRGYLGDGVSLHVWATWIETIAEQCIGGEQACGGGLEDACAAVVLRWSFYSAMVMRDLTLRSAASFGSFHLLNLLFNEYLLFFVEKKLDDHRRSVGLLAFWPSTAAAAVAAHGTGAGAGDGAYEGQPSNMASVTGPMTGLATAATASHSGTIIGGGHHGTVSGQAGGGFVFDDFFRKSAVLGPTSSPQPALSVKRTMAAGQGADDEEGIRMAFDEMAAAGAALPKASRILM